ncbi:hypothetical protein N7539_009158 [Penicillium diatomitis]|uniref:UBX domain-containing protein n=1 Tax=Penicillium diatomitis TaxID=2819901 RepID=A0A9W9WL95_9EURO|nr:uncharacterized protein N7539_009158 [Penicillium diatomitis]KAJ5469540.1 hypothetical protein N7539_009158 [Penicillium diatomitis]
MATFFEGSLQDGIAQAVHDASLSSTWENEYFADGEVAQALRDGSVLLRLTAGSQEAGFLSSFCPVAEFPAVIVIKNGKLEEYLLPGISKEAFRDRITAVLSGRKLSEPTTSLAQEQQQRQAAANTHSSVATPSPIPPAPAAVTQSPPPSSAISSRGSHPPESQSAKTSGTQQAKQPEPKSTKPKPQSAKQAKQEKLPSPTRHTRSTSTTSAHTRKGSVVKAASASASEPKPNPQHSAPRGPPSEYRLQVRLFDGRSIRSSFTPTQTIRNDVRPWLDQQMDGDKRPYNLKHVLTPLPSRTLSTSEESQALRDLGLGSTANLVMIPVASYTEAYASAATSLPARGISAVSNMVYTVASSAMNFAGSFIGYGSGATEANPPASSASPAAVEHTPRSRTTGPNIRTLHDQRNSRDDSQFYNGNQLNFEPRASERKDD